MNRFSEKRLRLIVEAKAGEHGLNPALVWAICIKESSLDQWAVRYEPDWRWLLNPIKWAKRVSITSKTERIAQSCSWGLMQIMGTVARERGLEDDIPCLLDPETGVEFGCRHLVYLLNRYEDALSALAAYNAGNPKSKVGAQYAQDVIRLMGEASKCH